MLERKLIITIGLPGSGKTRWARIRVKMRKPGLVVRVNRDDLRSMAHGGWTGLPRVEDQITAVQHAAIAAAWSTGAAEVIVDDTNLDPRHRAALESLAARDGATFEVVDMRNIPLEVCLARNASRSGAARIPSEEIHRLHRTWIVGART